MDIKSLEIKTKTNYNWDDIVYELVLIFIILDMFLTQIMIIIL